jgi:hypothetical protein
MRRSDGEDVMAMIIPLVPRAKTDAEGNLANFISSARGAITAFGAALDFDADKWDVTKYYSTKGHRNSKHGGITIHFTHRKKDGDKPFGVQIMEFAKAYVRTQLHSRNSASFGRTILAFRVLDTAIQQLNVLSLSDCDATVFNRASEIMKNEFENRDDAQGGAVLGILARFLDENGFVYAPLHDWRYIRARKTINSKVGAEFEGRRLKNLPAQRALDALAEAFHLAKEPRDVLITSLSAILCSAPERINEVMVLAENCEVEQCSRDGKQYLGLRWTGSKGASDHIKWVLPGMADVVRTALIRIRKIGETARRMAQWYEQNPGRLFLPPELEHLRTKEILTLDEVGSLLNLAPGKRTARQWLQTTSILPVYIPFRHPIKGLIDVQAVRYVDLERHIVGTLPLGFPMYDDARALKYSDALLLIPRGLFGIGRGNEGSRVMFEVVKYHHIGCALGQGQKSGSRTVFQRVGLDPDGDLAMRSHQFRHWLNTLAQGANLSQIDIAKWSGRATVQQNAAYDHVSSDEIVASMRAAIGNQSMVIGPLAEIPKNLPVTRTEFAKMVIPTAHLTLYGFCVHDFTALPCEMFQKCLECRELVCVKGMKKQTERIEQTLVETRKILDRATQAAVDGVYGAEDWITSHRSSIVRLEQLTNILTASEISDGALVQLNAGGAFSLSESALRDRDLLEHRLKIASDERKVPKENKKGNS